MQLQYLNVDLIRWMLRARNVTSAIREGWAGASWIVELVSTGRRGRLGWLNCS